MWTSWHPPSLTATAGWRGQLVALQVRISTAARDDLYVTRQAGPPLSQSARGKLLYAALKRASHERNRACTCSNAGALVMEAGVAPWPP